MFKLKIHFSCVAFIKHYAMKMSGRVGCIDLGVLIVITRWRGVVTFTPQVGVSWSQFG
jgi:hypothetical protein